MRSLIIVVENGKRTERYRLTFNVGQSEALYRIRQWLASACAGVGEDGVCRSFTVGVHSVGADCDHEQVGVRT